MVTFGIGMFIYGVGMLLFSQIKF